VWHLVVFNETTGGVLNKSSTPQGLAKDSVWARGQAWAVNGFTLAYRYTRLARYLSTAQQTADAFLRLVGACCNKTMVPLWDFNATTPEK
jgi:unsaturated chondroitin disaccharide hydrolase